ncbi:DnaD domain protein [Ligilactobacillus equi]|uniref:DnaB/C C-terminal domain-containing protein n=1 Tax=Ligilactobacillus equi DPC 6820 TaxID=1392007 RepID=V7HVI7_9LACO|nr:DnaD domain protein [Ligilactobacillus equi]ETA73238.1 hypothetical protein LEQ_1706c [Ligilactobacillus equi DPC 6820]
MKTRSIYFDSKHPIVIEVDMAVIFGLNEAIFLKQLNYWLQGSSGKLINGRLWVYNSYDNWQKDNFPFWSVSTVKRIIKKLENQGLVLVENYNKAGFDKTKWYSIDFDKFDNLMANRLGQNDQTSGSKWNGARGQSEQTNTRDYTEITTEIPSATSNAEIEQLADVQAHYQTNLRPRGGIPSAVNQWLADYTKQLGPELVKFAITKGVNQTSNPGPNYIKAILDSWKKKGIATVEQAENEKKVRTTSKRVSRKKEVANDGFGGFEEFL